MTTKTYDDSHDQTPDALVPIYDTPSANTPVKLFEGDMKLQLKSGPTPRVPGSVEVTWLPSPAIRFRASVSHSHLSFDNLDKASLEIPDLGVSCSVLVLRLDPRLTDDHCVYGGRLDSPTLVGGEKECREILFHLPNFHNFTGSRIRRDSGWWLGRLCLESADIRVMLDTKDKKTIGRLIGELKDQGGFALTHTGMLQKIDGSMISYDEATDLLFALHRFFSFARGFWCSPVLPTGLIDDENVWQLWKCSYQTSWKYVESWFPYDDLRDADQICQAFRGFMLRWHNALWRSPIIYAIHWYIEANIGAGGIGGSIILIQMALEMLSWVYLVEDTGRYSSTYFDDTSKMPAAEKIRKLLAELNIPTEIPAALDNFLSVTSSLNAADGPQAIVKFRNALVHPRKTKRERVSKIPLLARWEVKKLGLWYLEMVLLHLFGYEGEYYLRWLNGLPDDCRTTVPWAQKNQVP